MFNKKITRRRFAGGGVILGVLAAISSFDSLLPRPTVAEVTEKALTVGRDPEGEIVQLGSCSGRQEGNKGFYYTVSSGQGEVMPVSKKPEQWRLAEGETVTWWLVAPTGESQKICSL